MKTNLFTITMAILSLVACNKQELIPSSPTPEDGSEGEYMIEVLTDDGQTKSSPSTVELNLANLSYASSKSITAQLKKRTSTGWANVTTGVTYAWSASATDSKKFSGSGTNNQTCSMAAISAGSGKINVAASISGNQVANQDVPVTVSDSRSLSWTNATTSIVSGETNTAVLNSNFSCTATITSNNSNFLIGTASNNLSSSASVTFTTNKTQTIYYKYTGSEQTTVSLDAYFGKEKMATQTITISGPSVNTNFELWHIYWYTNGPGSFGTDKPYEDGEYLFLRETDGDASVQPNNTTEIRTLAFQGHSLYQMQYPFLFEALANEIVNDGLPGVDFNIPGITQYGYISSMITNTWVYKTDMLTASALWSRNELSGKSITFTGKSGDVHSFPINNLTYRTMTLDTNKYIEVYYY